jgi:hypothetical protein
VRSTGGEPTVGSRSTGDSAPWPGSVVADRLRACKPLKPIAVDITMLHQSQRNLLYLLQVDACRVDI